MTPAVACGRRGWQRAPVTEDAGFATAPHLEAPGPSLLAADPSHQAFDDRRDPLDLGFVVLGGVLAPLPSRVRLPHEDDDGEEVLA